jgi:hypothetical protein
MKKIALAVAASALLALPAAASAGNGYGKVVQDATGCTFGQLVVLSGGPQNHPIAGVGAKGLVEAVVAGDHPAPQGLCS